MASSPVHAKEALARIMIVEDDAIIAYDIKMMLQELGYLVPGIAASGAEALALAAQEKLDLVLMDVNIKGKIDGIQTAAQLVDLYRLPIVYVTAHTDDDTLARARDTEPFGYIAKPITTADVKVAVAVALTRHRAQKQVERHSDWLQTILQSTAEAMVITDGRGRISFLNRAAENLTGNANDTAQGRTFDEVVEIFDSDGKPQTLLPSRQIPAAESAFAITGTMIRPGQTRSQVLATVAPLQQGTNSGSVIVFHDISALWSRAQQLEETNQQLAHSNDKLTYLSYSLTHDLREPLRTINIYSELLSMQDKGALPSIAIDQLKAIGEASRRMGTVMSSLVEYYGASGLGRSAGQWVDANEPFQEALVNLSAAIDASQAQIETPSLPTVYAHPTALMLIFQNLIGNAVKYADRHAPFIRITSTREGEYWHFTVEDNGRGFDPLHAKEIFQLFKRAHGTDYPGAGIGLATCQRLVEQHEGKIWAESKPGDGARFHFTLPADPPAEANQASAS